MPDQSKSELAKAVAKAVGLDVQPDSFLCFVRGAANEDWRLFNPGVDANDAMEAAERFCRASDDYPRGLWLELNIGFEPPEASVEFRCYKANVPVAWVDARDELVAVHATALTAQLAICEAITKSKEPTGDDLRQD